MSGTVHRVFPQKDTRLKMMSVSKFENIILCGTSYHTASVVPGKGITTASLDVRARNSKKTILQLQLDKRNL